MNQLTTQPRFSQFINSPAVLSGTLKSMSEKNKEKFVSSIISAVSSNPALALCDHSTILSTALLGHSLNLSPSPMLGYFYFMPFNDRKNNRTVATFVLGYKGYIQLAMRSGAYKRLNVIPIKKGELKSINPVNEEYKFEIIEDDSIREAKDTCGYYVFFEMINGFQKAMYWSKEKMNAHALKYSKGYAAKKGYTFWEKDFDGMAMKTMLRQLISKWGTLSIDMEMGYEKDMTMENESGDPTYFDNQLIETKPIDSILFDETIKKEESKNEAVQNSDDQWQAMEKNLK